MTTSPIYSFPVKDLYNKDFDMTSLQGKVVLVVNTASQCGFTPQFADLESLHKQYSDKGLVILGFPCNQFGGQEPGVGEEIKTFCQRNYGVSFPMMQKIDVNGDNEHPLYSYIKKEKPGILGLQRIKWNFEKFLIDREGKVFSRYASTTNPSSMAGDIEKLL
ncbi:thioredoxin-like protein [Globomyces pollinis-pini]|nr:thioredoxin-like protein [Globomyces pollinis-pini]KAJ2994136.1 hypothetical protein HDV02_001833 [Globomyces sp. JEL0801]